MDPIKQLTTLFAEFPGIGPRQAKRFVYFLLRRNPSFLENLAQNIAELKTTIHLCPSCFQFFQKKHAGQNLCKICQDPNRDHAALLIVSEDTDLEHIEKTDLYDGYYFVLGGTLPILTQNPDERIRSRELLARVKKDLAGGKLKEIILALSATPEGEHTESYLLGLMQPLLDEANAEGTFDSLGSASTSPKVKISHLGRGISTGTEIEYSDTETLKNALENRR